MKIVFVCGCMEEGKDGVGDYTRRLAGQVIRLGHQATIISLMDKFVATKKEETQHYDQTPIAILRIPYNRQYKLNFIIAKNWVEKGKPDWISLQYVPFAYNNKGFPFFFGKYVNSITSNHHVHIMFHELWVGMDKDCSAKELLYGFLQRILIKAFIHKAKVKLVTTQSFLYAQQLAKLGVSATILPLFSNIRRIDFKTQKVKTAVENIPDSTICFGIFGTIHEKNDVASFASEVEVFCSKFNINAKLLLIGRCGKQKEYFTSVCQQHKIDIAAHEEITAEEVSKLLSTLDFGLTTTIYSKIDKSGSVAAMLEHGLSVISLAKKSEIDTALKSYLNKRFYSIYEYVPGGLETFLLSERKVPAFEELNEVSKQLLFLFDNKQQKNTY
ncbi:hypothetical protein [Parasediminibacterium sp. JCM 36343]|uniref:hypothetical protein n=1 Tax=Parasediminibacterium sp. JCM 36343 TaxID=3374279 RepID=UPI00397CBE49